MITMHAHPRQTDRQMDEHHGNSSLIRFNESIAHTDDKNTCSVAIIDRRRTKLVNGTVTKTLFTCSADFVSTPVTRCLVRRSFSRHVTATDCHTLMFVVIRCCIKQSLLHAELPICRRCWADQKIRITRVEK